MDDLPHSLGGPDTWVTMLAMKEAVDRILDGLGDDDSVLGEGDTLLRRVFMALKDNLDVHLYAVETGQPLSTHDRVDQVKRETADLFRPETVARLRQFASDNRLSALALKA